MSHEDDMSTPPKNQPNQHSGAEDINTGQSDPSTPPPLPPSLFELLHASIDQAKDVRAKDVQAKDSQTKDIDAQSIDARGTLETKPDRNIDAVDDGTNALLAQLGPMLRVWRIRQGYTRAQLAAQLGLDRSMLLALEQGIAPMQNISPDHLAALEALLTSSAVVDPRATDALSPGDTSPDNSL